jgi:hypothetical protein
MVVDTGAQISMLKRSLIPDNIPINTDTQYEIAGITTGSIKTLGSVELTLHDSAYRFQVAPEEIQLNEYGLIGRDILKYSVIYNKEGYVDICGHKYPFGLKDVKSVVVKPRTETIAEAWVDLDDGFGIVEKDEIYPGVYIASSMSPVKSKKAIVSILNSNEEATEITKLKVSATQWSEPVSVHKIETSVSGSTEGVLSRKRRVRELVRTDHMAASNKRAILDICEEFHDIFYLEGDKFRHTDLVKHSIPTPALDENRVINVRPYRLPEAHKEEVNRQIDKLLDEGIIEPSKALSTAHCFWYPRKQTPVVKSNSV